MDIVTKLLGETAHQDVPAHAVAKHTRHQNPWEWSNPDSAPHFQKAWEEISQFGAHEMEELFELLADLFEQTDKSDTFTDARGQKNFEAGRISQLMREAHSVIRARHGN